MKIKTLLASLLMFLFMAVPAFAAGSVMVPAWAAVGTNWKGQNMYKLTCAWTSDDATGAVSAVTSAAVNAQMIGKHLEMAITDPGATAPTDNYDITVVDTYGVDVMGGRLIDRDTANSEQVYPLVGTVSGPRPIASGLTISVSNAGNSKEGTLVLIFTD